ncbi:endolytic transglycosylase MltG [Clostridium merdae]|uniref:endolytic transglycosylase MltG n=1 Tax=Clostridium merdae TaxID=1958780 RepID=UPI000A26FB1C|nr:endolytic transglycosylase MltG [Clostridium merdae]
MREDENRRQNRSNEQQNRARDFRVNINDDAYRADSGAQSAGEPDVLHSYSSPQTRKAMVESEMRAMKAEERALKERSREKGRRNRNFFRMIWVAMVIILGIGIGQYLVTGIADMLAYQKQQTKVTVDIPKGASVGEIAKVLYKGGVINEPGFFQLYSGITRANNAYMNGTFELETDMDYEAIINYLQTDNNRTDIVKVMFQEGLNVQEIAALMEKSGVCSAKEILEYANSQDFNNYELIKSLGNASNRYYMLEGYLFPDTYEFYKDEDPKQALGKMINNTSKKLTTAIRDKAKEQGMSIDEVLNLASIIQAESADEDDMLQVSSVLHNRLKNGVATGTQKLGCDSTIFYPYRTKAQVPEAQRDTYTSRYNTYEITGLPPGPIVNPGIAAINAALSPAKTDYYYFCHSADGKAYYAKTAEQHQKNLKKAGLTK